VTGSVAEIGYRRLGGLDQMGDDPRRECRQPAVDPAARRSRVERDWLLRHFSAPLEKSFTSVYWDRRGAGKSFGRGIPRTSMTVERFVADLDELVDAVCERLGKRNCDPPESDRAGARAADARVPLRWSSRPLGPPETSVAYFDAVTAPSKKLVWLEHSCHEPFVDEPDKFNAAMAELVRPALRSDLPANAV
jgi:pimeloyl-ACP methyl ester carboxylesterase